MPNAATPPRVEVVNVVITVNGAPIPDACMVVSVNVKRFVNELAIGTVVISGIEALSGASVTTQSPGSILGATVDIRFGLGTSSASIFSGVISKCSIRGADNGLFQSVLTCSDSVSQMCQGIASGVYCDKSDEEILTQLTSAYGFTCTVDAPPIKHEQVIRTSSTDWDFLRRYTIANGLIALVNDTMVSVKKPEAGEASDLVAILGENVIDFDLEIDAPNQAEVTGHGDVLAADGHQAGSVETVRGCTRGKITMAGSSLAVPGRTVRLAQFGPVFDNDVFIAGVSHVLEEGTWTTVMHLGLPSLTSNERTDLVGRSAHSEVSSSVHRGIVVQTGDDPQGLMRVLVTLPAIDAINPVWARMSAPYLSKGAGILFPPEVGDEVSVTFMEREPNAPIVLGSLYSHEPDEQIAAVDTACMKAILTRGKLRIGLDDDKKVITIETPGGNRLSLNDDTGSICIEDANENQILMNRDGISLKSTSNFSIQADGAIKISGRGGIDLAAEESIKFEAQMIDGEASIGIKLTGAASAELSSSGEVTVKGSIVMIN